jgi:hypothetical protein
MEELNDKDFDQIFKNKVTSSYLEFEEDSWVKMEKKLRKRDRFVFLRNASIILLFLSFGIGFYIASNQTPKINEVNARKKTKAPEIDDSKPFSVNPVILSKKKEHPASKRMPTNSHHPAIEASSPLFIAEPIIANSSPTPNQNQVATTNAGTTDLQNSITPPLTEPESTSKVKKERSKLPISIAFVVGPDFSSTKRTLGGKGGMAIGVGLSVGISKKLSIQTGLNYGAKNYDAEAYDYTFRNPGVVSTIAGIDASCRVIEIPLRASYTLIDNQKSSFQINTGLSSYLMLKENYRFIYTAASGRQDRFLEEKNANQHYLSVIDLSATYNIKLKNKNFALGVEPYVKIPLGGIGAGNVPLKSSGISLKLNYEFSKQQ